MRLAPSTQRVRDGVGRRIAELRTERGWTQGELAHRMGHTESYQSAVERGKFNLRLDTLTMFAQVLRVAPVDLLAEPSSRAKRSPGRPRKTQITR
jgi:XRE family transcriptional regulator, fatty acid utilization regulator